MNINHEAGGNLCESKPCEKGFGKCPHYSRFSGYVVPGFIPRPDICLVDFYANLDLKNYLCGDCADKDKCNKNGCEDYNLRFRRYQSVKSIARQAILEHSKTN